MRSGKLRTLNNMDYDDIDTTSGQYEFNVIEPYESEMRDREIDYKEAKSE